MNVTNKVLVLLEHFDDGQGEPIVFWDTPEGRAKMDAQFRMRVRDNIGERDFDGDVRELTEEEITEEIEEAIRTTTNGRDGIARCRRFIARLSDRRLPARLSSQH
jgi:hypothetical protein